MICISTLYLPNDYCEFDRARLALKKLASRNAHLLTVFGMEKERAP